MASTWGRKETLITPPTVPVYTFTAFGVALVCLCFFAWQSVAFSMPIMQRSYFTEYVRAAVGSTFHHAGKYRLFYLYGAAKRQQRLALPVDFENGRTTLPNGKIVPVQLSALPQAQGYRSFGRSLPEKFQDASLYRWLRFTFFRGESVPRLFLQSSIESGVLLAMMLWFAVPADIKRLKLVKYGRVLRGPEMMSPSEFHHAVMREFWRHPLGEFRAWRATKKGGNQAHLGLGFKTTEMTGLMRIPPGKESQHFQMMGDTGAGKTTLIMQLLRQIRDRGDVAIVYDPASEFVQRFYDKGRGDIILNPLDARCPFWSPAMEIESNQEATTISESLYQPSGGSSNSSNKEFFYRTPAQMRISCKRSSRERRWRSISTARLAPRLRAFWPVSDSSRRAFDCFRKGRKQSPLGTPRIGLKSARAGSSLPPRRPSARCFAHSYHSGLTFSSCGSWMFPGRGKSRSGL
jgi:hypothetical protein